MTEQNFNAMRQAMVESQLRTTAVNDPRVVAAMATVARERFVPADRRALAYIDRPLPLANGRELNLPEATGRLLTEARVLPTDRVLLVGAASGYTAALLAELAGHVIALEQDPALVSVAREALAGIDAIEVVEGPLAAGWGPLAPYDLIFVDGLIEQVPQALIDQLREEGRLACAIADQNVSRLALGRKAGSGFGLFAFADAEACRLPGFEKPKTFSF